jgi:4-hydroxy-tetrahydrodipicolinate reductase
MTDSQPSRRARIVVHGATGRMGQAIIRSILGSSRSELACALVRPTSDHVDEPISDEFGMRAPDVDFVSALDPDVVADVLVDFSGVQAFDSALAMAHEHRLAFVSGTTGLSDDQHAALEHAAKTIPVLWASNFSLGVAMLERLARRTAAALADWDCDIVEMHHRRKRDAPSGTALTLGHAVAEGHGVALDDHARYIRHGQTGERPPGEIGFAAVRAGDVVGEHTVIFATDGERLELVHRATSRDIFARGALAAAIWIVGRDPGLYTFDQVLAPKD